jgi:inner membrane protein
VATIFSHALVAITATRLACREDRNNRIALWAVVLSLLPDLDVLTFPFGVQYGDFFGHRGFTHSLIFALMISVLVVAARFRDLPRWSARWWGLTGFFFLVTASHGVLDAMTDGGLGIAFFSPFENSRYFLPWTPLQVSPIGRGFFSGEGLEVLSNEARWIGLPCAVLLVLAKLIATRNARLSNNR